MRKYVQRGNRDPNAVHGKPHPALMNTQAELIDWLRDIYAMDKAMETALNKLTDHPQHYPALRKQAALHCTETRRHAEAIAIFLKQLGSDTSSLKAVLAQGMGLDFMRSAGAAFARDERIKDVLTVLVTEHFEIACHTILRTRASQLGLLEIVRICDQILSEENRMVSWLQQNMPHIFAAYLSQEKETETEHEFAATRSVDAEDRVQWEFVQLAQNASLFGGPLPRSSFADMQN
jgi:ferritin-like metal-binding protein YciE